MLAALGQASGIYTPAYVLRVLYYRDANVDDFRWKQAAPVPASSKPRPLTPMIDPAVEAAFGRALEGESLDAFMTRTGTRSLLVVRPGQLLLERYSDATAADTPQAVFSVSKSVLSLLIGQALSTGKLSSLEVPVTTILPSLAERDARMKDITLAQLLDMRSGLAYEDELSFPILNNDAPLVYYAGDLRRVLLEKARPASAPGPFHYNDYNPNMLAWAVGEAVDDATLARPRAALWEQLGAEDEASWSVDDTGFPYWESGFVATPRDLAKLAASLIGDPQQDSTIFPTAWRERVTRYQPKTHPAVYDGRQWSYRGGWWLVLRPDGNHDFAAIGRFGQFIYVSPANGIAFVRTGGDAVVPGDGDLASLFYRVASDVGRRENRRRFDANGA